MREIIFRGKRMDNGEWVYGHIYSQVDLPDTIEEEWYWYIKPIGSESWVSYRVDPYTVGQYTGLMDKHGKRIFEGDILSFRAGRTYVVRFEDGAFILEDSAIPIPFAIKSEIIGNVHDNPELLKEEKP